ncbi:MULTISPECIES: hypothetical protein [Shewanella]|uniref:Uncharacterized protein n=1 Tax=Shewanella phaeophyticola TaxID=2978345 RepID=A0ABT2P495_9GAMM|nr:hypothetical protein [Shewanella sp. KJ10-1]MCT8987482.1 hypothetical protein [Shewanella sp. KJ10-1]
MTNIGNYTLTFLSIGLLLGAVIGYVAFSVSNLILGAVSLIAWLVLMVGIPPSNSSKLRMALFYMSLTLLPVTWAVYIWLG